MDVTAQSDGVHVAITLEGLSHEGLIFHIFFSKKQPKEQQHEEEPDKPG